MRYPASSSSWWFLRRRFAAFVSDRPVIEYRTPPSNHRGNFSPPVSVYTTMSAALRIPYLGNWLLSARLSAAGLVGALAVCLGMSPPRPADFDALHAEAAAANPSDLHLRLSLAGGRTQFHLGELVKVQYELTSDTPGEYRSGDLWYDLSERSRFESFISDRPANSADPLDGYWTIWETL